MSQRLSDEQITAIKAAYLKAKGEMPLNVSAAKRVHVSHSEWFEDWWVGWGKDEGCQIEGTANHWRWLALLLLGLADRMDTPYSEDKPTPEIALDLLADLEEARETIKVVTDATNALAARTARVEADLEEARAALRAIEWIQPEALLHYQSYCPECGNYQTTGHKSDCAIGKALAATEEKA